MIFLNYFFSLFFIPTTVSPTSSPPLPSPPSIQLFTHPPSPFRNGRPPSHGRQQRMPRVKLRQDQAPPLLPRIRVGRGKPAWGIGSQNLTQEAGTLLGAPQIDQDSCVTVMHMQRT